MKTRLLQILILLNGLSAWAQADRLDSLLGEIVWKDKEWMRLLDPPTLYGYFMVGAAGESKAVFSGQETVPEMYSLFGSLYLFHARGFFAGASGSWFSHINPGYFRTTLSAGVNRPINHKKTLYFRLSYSRYLFNQADTASVNAFSNNLTTGLSFRNQWLGARLSANLLFGKELGMNVTPGVFVSIPIIRFGKYNKIWLEPEISAFFGSAAVAYETNPCYPGSTTSALTTGNKYGIQNTQFYIPVCMYIGDFDLELGYFLNLPFNRDTSPDQQSGSFFSITLGYLLPIK